MNNLRKCVKRLRLKACIAILVLALFSSSATPKPIDVSHLIEMAERTFDFFDDLSDQIEESVDLFTRLNGIASDAFTSGALSVEDAAVDQTISDLESAIANIPKVEFSPISTSVISPLSDDRHQLRKQIRSGVFILTQAKAELDAESNTISQLKQFQTNLRNYRSRISEYGDRIKWMLALAEFPSTRDAAWRAYAIIFEFPEKLTRIENKFKSVVESHKSSFDAYVGEIRSLVDSTKLGIAKEKMQLAADEAELARKQADLKTLGEQLNAAQVAYGEKNERFRNENINITTLTQQLADLQGRLAALERDRQEAYHRREQAFELATRQYRCPNWKDRIVSWQECVHQPNKDYFVAQSNASGPTLYRILGTRLKEIDDALRSNGRLQTSMRDTIRIANARRDNLIAELSLISDSLGILRLSFFNLNNALQKFVESTSIDIFMRENRENEMFLAKVSEIRI